MKRHIELIWLVVVLTMPRIAPAEIPSLINYQGRMLDHHGNLVSSNVTVSIGIYTNPTLGQAVYTENVGTVAVNNGVYSLMFGTNKAAIMDVFKNPETWLEVSVNGIKVLPRQRLVAVPYAIRSGEVAAITSNTVFESNVIPSDAIASGAIGQDQLAKKYLSGVIPLSDLVTNPSDLGIEAETNQVFAQPFGTVPAVTLSPVAAGVAGVDGLIARLTSVNEAEFTVSLSGNFFVERTIFHNTDTQLDFTLINGKPACAFRATILGDGQIHYLQAVDNLGSQWRDSIVVVTNVVNADPYALSEIGGKPAIIYRDSTNLNFIIGADVNGDAWQAPNTVFAGPNIGYASLAEVNGKPAVAHNGGIPESVRYTRALDNDGNAWGLSIVVTNTGHKIVGLAVVGGNPAVALNGPRFFRALDQDGATWGKGVTLGTFAIFLSFEVVNGNPAFAYETDENHPEVDMRNKILYQRAMDPSGTNWGVTHILSPSSKATDPILTSASNGPIVFFLDSLNWAVSARDANGTNGGVPRTISQRKATAAATVAGQPAFITMGLALHYHRFTPASERAIQWLAVEP
jgi:hypothetical protein